MLKFLFAVLLCAAPAAVYADDAGLPPELQGLGLDEAILPIGTDDNGAAASSRRTLRQQSIIPFIADSIPQAAAYNISNAEQVFCYHVGRRPQGYTGYTLNNFAIADYCGELDMGQRATTYEALFTQSPNIITAPAQCKIAPRVMLRFVRGVDFTDVLLSSPCPSFTVFYAGKYHAFNIKQGIIDDIISQFNNSISTFNSPSYLRQTVANGTASTDKEAEQYEKKQRENAPVMNWKKPAAADTASSAAEKPRKGWGNIKLNI